VDESPAGEVIPVHERDRGAARPGAGGPPDPVQVGLLVLGALVVDDVRDVVDVDPAGGDVGGDEHVHLSAAERAQGLLASTLAEIPVQGSGSEPAIDEILRSEEHTSELQSRFDLVCRLLLEKKKNKNK